MTLARAWALLSFSAGAQVALLGALLIYAGIAIGAAHKPRNRRK